MYSKDFGPFEGKVWLNSASEGALPHVSVAALQEAITWKTKPFLLTHQRFAQVPARLKAALAELINADPLDVILGNSATYGIHLLANGIPLKRGDEILLMQNDFPTDILPWLTLQDKGVSVKQLPSRLPVIQPDEVASAITPHTRVVCLAHVHTFSGHIVDIQAISELCRKKNIIFVVNVSQSLGYLPFSVKSLAVDAITCAGFKWLCGPYATGFCWATPALRERLTYRQAFWVNTMNETDLSHTGDLTWTARNDAQTFDVFGTANFFNFVPWTASLEYLSKIGAANIARIIDERVEQLLNGLDPQKYHFLSPLEKGKRSALVVFTHRDPAQNFAVFRGLLDAGIFIAKWKGNLRVSPHIFNTPDEIDRALKILNSFSS